MKPLTLLLIPLLFLSSCSIDWNDEKDAKIAELEKQISSSYTEKQINCSQRAKEYIETTAFADAGRQENHYNRKIDGCFIKLSLLRNNLSQVEIIYNVDENKQLIRYDSTDKSLSRIEFDSKIKEYMEN